MTEVTPSTGKALVCRGLWRSYGPTVAVRDFSLEVDRGELVVLFGPSGCGKTTALELIAGLKRPDAGEVYIEGEQVSGNRWVPAEKRRVGLVFQDVALFPHLDVASNVAFGIRTLPRVDRERRVTQVLEVVRMQDLARRMPHELSGGQQQRVALARSLAPWPRLVLLDEPFSNLDVALREQLRHEVRSVLEKEEVPAVFVTHDVEEALCLADRIVVMKEGTVRAEGPPEAIYRRPPTLEVAQLLGQLNSFVVDVSEGVGTASPLGTFRLSERLDGRVTVGLWPECLYAVPDAYGPLRVAEVEFYGHDCMVFVEDDSGRTLQVRLLGSRPLPAKGERVSVFAGQSAMVFGEDGVLLPFQAKFSEATWALDAAVRFDTVRPGSIASTKQETSPRQVERAAR